MPPVFKRTFEPYEAFRKVITDLISTLAKTQIEFENEGDEVVQAEFEGVANDLIEASGIDIPAQAMIDVATTIRPKERSVLLNDALAVLKLLYEEGIYSNRGSGQSLSELTVIQLIDEDGQNNLPLAQSLDDALVTLRVRINALSRDKETARKLFEVFRAGLQVNLVYSESGTQKAKQRAIDALQIEPIRFVEGDTLIEPGAIITTFDLERVDAYQKAELELGSDSILIEPLFLQRMMLTAILLIAVYIYMKEGIGTIYKRNRAIAITAVSILLNLLIIRLIMEIGEIAALSDRPMVRMLPFITPYALAPILVAVLVGAAPAILAQFSSSPCCSASFKTTPSISC